METFRRLEKAEGTAAHCAAVPSALFYKLKYKEKGKFKLQISDYRGRKSAKTFYRSLAVAAIAMHRGRRHA